jgi:hypothetical protein
MLILALLARTLIVLTLLAQAALLVLLAGPFAHATLTALLVALAAVLAGALAHATLTTLLTTLTAVLALLAGTLAIAALLALLTALLVLLARLAGAALFHVITHFHLLRRCCAGFLPPVSINRQDALLFRCNRGAHAPVRGMPPGTGRECGQGSCTPSPAPRRNNSKGGRFPLVRRRRTGWPAGRRQMREPNRDRPSETPQNPSDEDRESKRETTDTSRSIEAGIGSRSEAVRADPGAGVESARDMPRDGADDPQRGQGVYARGRNPEQDHNSDRFGDHGGRPAPAHDQTGLQGQAQPATGREPRPRDRDNRG